MEEMEGRVNPGRGGHPLEIVRAAGVPAAILGPEEPRWPRVHVEPGPGIDLRDHFRGALIGGAIGDAMGRANEGVRPSEARKRRLRDHVPWPGYSNPGRCQV